MRGVSVVLFALLLCRVKAQQGSRCQGKWTQWFDRDNPDEDGDSETLADLWNEEYGLICRSPTLIDARIRGTEIRYNRNDDDISAYPLTGFRCRNKPKKRCRDYEVRFCCEIDPPKCRGHWTEWFDSDNPSREGDHELISNLLRRHPGKLCYQPIAIDARLAETEIRYDHALPNVEIDTEIGFKCNNEEGRQCPNYEVRFCCQEAVVPKCAGKSYWTPWLDRDNATGGGDYELIKDLILEEPKVCFRPIAIDARIVGGRRYDPHFPRITVNKDIGFQCNSSKELPCADYEVRFCCPERRLPKCPTGRRWTSWYDISDPTGRGDDELLEIMRRRHRNQICYSPSVIDAKLVNSSLRYDHTLPNVAVSPSTGLRCTNKEGPRCRDYEVRFCCRQAPKISCTRWTTWFDSDKPNGECDCEDIEQIVNRNPGVACYRPTAVDARLKLTNESLRYDPTLPNLLLDRKIGFRCMNRDGLKCQNYEARFCCPRAPVKKCPVAKYWTQWYDNDDPQGNGDEETLDALREEYPYEVCFKPHIIEARLKGSNLKHDHTLPNIVINNKLGFRCSNADGPPCSDYEVRLCCVPAPEPSCPTRTYLGYYNRYAYYSWTQWYDRDDGDGTGDIETIALLRRERPDDNICATPYAVDARLKRNRIRHDPNQPNIVMNTKIGFRCNNREPFPPCRDYEVRFCCRTS
ncbi:unnamed protein product [Clavelina lepadiformis]|uniref:WxxW domain-containing protein n=1 Tax=Clavelina lepadiformis TaxID=159417 RepID=A0ABP0F3R2_CLALP